MCVCVRIFVTVLFLRVTVEWLMAIYWNGSWAHWINLRTYTHAHIGTHHIMYSVLCIYNFVFAFDFVYCVHTRTLAYCTHKICIMLYYARNVRLILTQQVEIIINKYPARNADNFLFVISLVSRNLMSTNVNRFELQRLFDAHFDYNCCLYFCFRIVHRFDLNRNFSL